MKAPQLRENMRRNFKLAYVASSMLLILIGPDLIPSCTAAALPTLKADNALVRSPPLRCPDGLSIHTDASAQEDALTVHTRGGVAIRISKSSTKITRDMVVGAEIRAYEMLEGPPEGSRTRALEVFFGVGLELTPSAAISVEQALGTTAHKSLVAVCGGSVLLGYAIGRDRLEEISVTIHDSAAAAEHFARSFTGNVRFRSPAARDESPEGETHGEPSPTQ